MRRLSLWPSARALERLLAQLLVSDPLSLAASGACATHALDALRAAGDLRSLSRFAAIAAPLFGCLFSQLPFLVACLTDFVLRSACRKTRFSGIADFVDFHLGRRKPHGLKPCLPKTPVFRPSLAI